MKNLDNIIKKILKEEEEHRSGRYMFFSNLQQMRRQCDLLLDLDQEMVESILENGHDWAQDHIAEAKNNMDQVFDFIMNESKKDGMEMSMSVDDGFWMSVVFRVPVMALPQVLLTRLASSKCLPMQ